jgi:poly(hydroxyalkanoate) granule-associated protein
MGTKRKSRRQARTGDGSTQARLLDTVHQVWLAGLGAVSKAHSGAPKLLEELVAEGARVHADTRDAAEKALRGVLGEVQSTLNARMGQVHGKATDAFENLEKIFQTRVHRALTQLGVPSADEVEALSKRVDTLNTNIEKLARGHKPTSRARANTVRKGTAARAAAS